jgi:hypothetical protein
MGGHLYDSGSARLHQEFEKLALEAYDTHQCDACYPVTTFLSDQVQCCSLQAHS